MNPTETSTVHLHCGPLASLDDPRTRDTIIATAHGIAERTGVGLRSVEVDDEGRLRLTIEGPELVALGLAAQLRRDTDRWHRGRTGHAFWTGPDVEGRS